jgi:hypothetical protein
MASPAAIPKNATFVFSADRLTPRLVGETRNMNRQFVAVGLLSAAALVGCQNMSHTERGAGLGGALGAGMGAIAGSGSGNAGKGALIGGAAGALLGGLAGNAEDKAEMREMRAAQQQQAAARAALSVQEICAMSQQGISEPIIVNQIKTTGARYNLSPSDIAYLKQSNVSDNVIMEMQRTARAAAPVVVAPPPQTVIVEQPVYRPAPVFVAPPPPPSVGVGFHYSNVRRR